MHVLQTGSTFRLLGLRARWATQANGTSVGRQRPRFGGTHPTNWSVGFSSMQMRHVKSVGGGLRGLGLGFGLRFFAQGSARGRLFLVTFVGAAFVAACLV